MLADQIESLPLAHRLALSYAPQASRDAVLSLLLLDQRLADILRKQSEPLIAQMKLAWWRDRFAEDPVNWPKGEPLLERLREWPGATRELVAMADGWEMLVGEDLTAKALETYANGRASGWMALAQALREDEPAESTRNAGREWALSDLAIHLEDAGERAQVKAMIAGGFDTPRALPRGLRSLAILRGLGRRAVRRGDTELLTGAGAFGLAMRIGITGR